MNVRKSSKIISYAELVRAGGFRNVASTLLMGLRKEVGLRDGR
jgi:hypothetical protein